MALGSYWPYAGSIPVAHPYGVRRPMVGCLTVNQVICEFDSRRTPLKKGKAMNKKVLIALVVLCLVIAVVPYFFQSAAQYQNTQQPQQDASVEKEPEEASNAMLLQYVGGEYICWKKYGSFMFVSSDKRDFEFRYEEHRYRVYIIGNTRLVNFKGDDWDRAAYYLGAKIENCIGKSPGRIGVR